MTTSIVPFEKNTGALYANVIMPSPERPSFESEFASQERPPQQPESSASAVERKAGDAADFSRAQELLDEIARLRRERTQAEEMLSDARQGEAKSSLREIEGRLEHIPDEIAARETALQTLSTEYDDSFGRDVRDLVKSRKQVAESKADVAQIEAQIDVFQKDGDAAIVASLTRLRDERNAERFAAGAVEAALAKKYEEAPQQVKETIDDVELKVLLYNPDRVEQARGKERIVTDEEANKVAELNRREADTYLAITRQLRAEGKIGAGSTLEVRTDGAYEVSAVGRRLLAGPDQPEVAAYLEARRQERGFTEELKTRYADKLIEAVPAFQREDAIAHAERNRITDEINAGKRAKKVDAKKSDPRAFEATGVGKAPAQAEVAAPPAAVEAAEAQAAETEDKTAEYSPESLANLENEKTKTEKSEYAKGEALLDKVFSVTADANSADALQEQFDAHLALQEQVSPELAGDLRARERLGYALQDAQGEAGDLAKSLIEGELTDAERESIRRRQESALKTISGLRKEIANIRAKRGYSTKSAGPKTVPRRIPDSQKPTQELSQGITEVDVESQQETQSDEGERDGRAAA